MSDTVKLKALTLDLVAGEESGDALGGALMQALRRLHPGDIDFAGVGGRAMGQHGIASPFPIEELAMIGAGGVLRQLPRLLRRIRNTADAIVTRRPDALIIIDSPEFTHRVARRVRKAAPAIPIIDYVSPSVWAWRPWRAGAMRAYVDHVLAILPFEPAVHLRLGGPPCTFVGHPLSERIGALRPSPQEVRRRLADPPVILALPGSRRSEIRRLIAPFGAALARVADAAGPLELVLPTVPHLVADVAEATAAWPVRPRIVVDPADKDAAFRAARAALAASGTVTLELAFAGVPTVAAYRVPAWEGSLFRLLASRYIDTVILANLVLGEKTVPELLQGDCTPERLAAGLIPLIADTPARRRQIEAFARIDTVMQVDAGAPSLRAAAAILEIAAKGRASP
jgi:lipid-A-disaccharide synthase